MKAEIIAELIAKGDNGSRNLYQPFLVLHKTNARDRVQKHQGKAAHPF